MLDLLIHKNSFHLVHNTMHSRLIVDLRSGLSALALVSILALTTYGQETTDEMSSTNESVAGASAPHPLQPADTSSPRDTLRGFLTDSRRAFTAWEQSGKLETPAGYQAYSRAISTLDFSTTPRGNAHSIQTLRLLMLRETLDRLEIPEDMEIPGDDDLEEREVRRWRIPNTDIAIERIEEGPRKGEYLFSAGTVERLGQFYRMTKHLPYQPGALEGIYEKYLSSSTGSNYQETKIRNRLQPVDLTNPRSTLLGFLDSVNRAYAIVMEAEAGRSSNPPTLTIAEVTEMQVTAENLLQRAIAALDLSQIPEASRESVAIERTLELKEILDRLNLPPIRFVPDAAMVELERERLRDKAAGATLPVRYRIPNTTLEIVEVLEGDHKGIFQFSGDTINRLDSQFAAIRKLPYRRDMSEIVLEYPSPEISEGFYDYYVSTPGRLIPHATVLGRLIDGLPPSFYSVYSEQTTWQWSLLLLSLLVVILVSGLVLIACRFIADKASSPWDEWLQLITPILIIGLILYTIDFLDKDVNLTGTVLRMVISIGNLFVIVLTGYFVFMLCHALSGTLIALPVIRDRAINATMLRLSASVIGTLLFMWILVTGLTRLGIDMVPLIAGLGVGGLAIALAARPTIENIIGSFMIFWDKPYVVGQRIKVLDHDGTVEAIGLRSTKIRLRDGHLTSIPNEKMAVVEIENVSSRPFIRRLLDVKITYDTPPDKIKRAMEILEEILSVPEPEESKEESDAQERADDMPDGAASDDVNKRNEEHPNSPINQPDLPPRVCFNEMNDDSLNIMVIYWYHPADFWGYAEHATSVNMQIMERFAAESIEFAFPTQTLHLTGDENRPVTVDQR